MVFVVGRRPFQSELRAGSLLFILSWCVGLVPEHQASAEPPLTIAPFEDIVTTAHVTQRFEIYNPHSREQLRAVKAMGFTQVILDWPNLHADATELGLDVVLANWWTPETKPEEIEQGLERARQVDRRRLSAVSVMDEPERNSPDTPFTYYQELYSKLRPQLDRELPEVAIEISHWGPLSSWTPQFYEAFVPLYQATDRIRLMPYPDLDEGPLGEVYYQMLRSRRLMKLAGRDLPQVVILQTWVLPENPKLPTIAELRVMAYLAILGGADTLSFFSYNPELWSLTEGFEDGFANLMSELTEFTHRYHNAVVESRLSSKGVFTATLTSSFGELTTIVINTSRTSVDSLAALEVVIREPSRSAVASQGDDPDGVRQRRATRSGWLSRRRSGRCHR